MSLFSPNSHYYHATTKSLIIAFGSIFDGVTVEKYDAVGTKIQDYVVPIDFAPKNKWVSMINERPDFTTNQVQLTIPRMAYEISSWSPNMSRKIGFNGTSFTGNLLGGGKTKIFNPSPVDIVMNLYVMTKDNDDMFQIIEQIIPYFQPSLTINFDLLPEFGVKKDVQISLVNVQTTDSYNSSIDDQRYVESTFTFNIPMYYFGPVQSKRGVIKDAKIAVTDNKGKVENFETKVNPITANITDAHTITEKWTS